ncbi:MAG: hypothetical protein ACTTG8_04185 [Catonella sp.]|uniref:hypothetical protein n=1 Tax=Catonella sp. TaxID=2382125 RepID=UPI003F9F754F
MSDKQYEFSNRLADLIAQAHMSGNKIHESDIREFFEDLELDESHFNHIFAYLKASHIAIEGCESKEEIEEEAKKYAEAAKAQLEEAAREGLEKKSNIKDTKKTIKYQSEFLNMYLNELKHIEKMTLKEEQNIMKLLLEGDEESETSYIDRKLHKVVEIARGFELTEDYFKELIEEGNIGLLMGIKELKEKPEEENPIEFIESRIESAMQDFLEESLEIESTANAMVAKVNFVSDAAKKMKEMNGSSPTLKELASYTNLTEAELTDIIELSGDNLKSKE